MKRDKNQYFELHFTLVIPNTSRNISGAKDKLALHLCVYWNPLVHPTGMKDNHRATDFSYFLLLFPDTL